MGRPLVAIRKRNWGYRALLNRHGGSTMVGSRWKLFFFRRRTVNGRSGTARRPGTKLSPRGEALDHRQLLSSVAAATGLSMPPATAAANAATILESHAPHAFGLFQAALTRAEEESKFNPSEVNALAQDEAVVDQAIDSAGLTSSARSTALNDVQDWVDNAFTYGPGGIRDAARRVVPLSQAGQRLDSILEDVPAVSAASDSTTAGSPINQLIDQITVVAKEASATPAVQSALEQSYDVLNKALGRSPYTDLGPGATHRDPLVVYYNAQVSNFVR
jgi:hypothetical protein